MSNEKRLPPNPSNFENNFSNLIEQGGVKSWADLQKIGAYYLTKYCKGQGAETLKNTTIPNLRQVYGTNLRKGAERLLKILKYCFKFQRENLDHYLKDVVTQEELRFSKVDKERMLQAIVKSIKSVISDENKLYAEECKGVIAVIVFGSFAKKEFHLHSDLDVYIITHKNKAQIPSPKLKSNYVSYIDRFKNKLSERLQGKTINQFQEAVPVSKVVDLELGIKGFNDKYIIVTPYQNIQTFIQDILHNKKR